MQKLTFIGDIVCDREMLKQSKNGRNKFDFTNMFQPLTNYFNNSNYVIANLESIIDNHSYTHSAFSFSNPYSLLTALKKIGITHVSLANNHILDRNEEGIKKTIYYLNKAGINYFGIKEENNANSDLKLDDIKVYILGYTDSTNYHINKKNITDLKHYKINMLRFEKNNNLSKSFSFKKIYRKLNADLRLKIESILQIKLKPITDNYQVDNKILKSLKDKISELKHQGNYIIMYSHIGGQFNPKMGSYSKSMIDEFNKMNIDFTIITHPHVIQEKYKDNAISIGDLAISSNSKFVIWESLPQYSLTINYYFNKKELLKITVSFLICIKDKNSYLKIYPFYNFYNGLDTKNKKIYFDEFKKVYKRVFNNELKIKNEYILWQVR